MINPARERSGPPFSCALPGRLQRSMRLFSLGSHPSVFPGHSRVWRANADGRGRSDHAEPRRWGSGRPFSSRFEAEPPLACRFCQRTNMALSCSQTSRWRYLVRTRQT